MKKVNFGKYPADYELAYATMAGLTKAPTVRSLFGPKAKFATTFSGIPVTITLESVKALSDSFTAKLLMTLNVKGKKPQKAIRLFVKFVPDSMTETTHVDDFVLANLLNGQKTEEQSYGDAQSDAQAIGAFISSMDMFWDTTEYKN
jgi:hypothetical protein